jgi:hypothetical protein
MNGYDFRSLSSADFELLACDVLNTDQGLALHGYPAGRDDGIDLRYVAPDGFTTIAQCKHYRDSDAGTFRRAVVKESNKSAIRLAGRYIFITSHPLTPGRELEVAAILNISVRDVWGQDRINRVLREHPEIERRHFKLWLHSATVLEQIIQAGLWRHTGNLLTDMAYHARYWVDVPAYALARELLEQEGVCIIAGGPGVGKSFLAERLMLQALSDGWEIVDVTDDIGAAWNVAGHDCRRLFYLDDFLGEAELRHDAADDAKSLLAFISHVGRDKDNLRLIMTTREQVLTQAAYSASDSLNRLAERPARCILALPALNEATRTEILLSHAYQSDLPAEERAKLADDNRLRTLAAHPSFSPRLVRSVLTDRMLSHDTADNVLDLLTAVFADPAELWRASFEALDELAQQILLVLMTFPARTVPSRQLRDAVEPEKPALIWMRSFRTLEPAWVRLVGPRDHRSVAFANPGCRDFLLGLLELHGGALARDLVGAGLGRIEQLTCLSQAAGLLTADGVVPLAAPPARPVLYSVLIENRGLLSACIEELWRAGQSHGDGVLGSELLRLRDAAALVACYGDGDCPAWLRREVEVLLDDQAEAIPCIPALALARRLLRLLTGPAPESDVDAVALRLVAAALTRADDLRDLDAYEDLPDALRTAATQQTARRRAGQIIENELDRLAHETPDASELEACVHDMRARAAWYSLDFDFDPLLDLIDELGSPEVIEP